MEGRRKGYEGAGLRPWVQDVLLTVRKGEWEDMVLKSISFLSLSPSPFYSNQSAFIAFFPGWKIKMIWNVLCRTRKLLCVQLKGKSTSPTRSTYAHSRNMILLRAYWFNYKCIVELPVESMYLLGLLTLAVSSIFQAIRIICCISFLAWLV